MDRAPEPSRWVMIPDESPIVAIGSYRRGVRYQLPQAEAARLVARGMMFLPDPEE
jgi:hypothetical protein